MSRSAVPDVQHAATGRRRAWQSPLAVKAALRSSVTGVQSMSGQEASV